MRRARLPAIVFLAGLGGAPACAPDEATVGGVYGDETGLTAEYFDGLSLQRPSGLYQDANIDFEGWELNRRIDARGHWPRTVSIRWTGALRVEPDAPGQPHTIGFELRGRVRIWIDGGLIVDDWTDGGVLREAWGALPPSDDGWRALRIEWDQAAGPMTARLRAGAGARPRTIVPPAALRGPSVTGQ